MQLLDLFTIVLSVITIPADATPLGIEIAKPTLACGLRGTDRNTPTFLSQSQCSLSQCAANCEKAPTCRSYGYGNGYCRLYSTSCSAFVQRDGSAPFTFNDKACPRPVATTSTTSTRATTTTTAKTTTTMAKQTTTSVKLSTTTSTSTSVPITASSTSGSPTYTSAANLITTTSSTIISSTSSSTTTSVSATTQAIETSTTADLATTTSSTSTTTSSIAAPSCTSFLIQMQDGRYLMNNNDPDMPFIYPVLSVDAATRYTLDDTHIRAGDLFWIKGNGRASGVFLFTEGSGLPSLSCVLTDDGALTCGDPNVDVELFLIICPFGNYRMSIVDHVDDGCTQLSLTAIDAVVGECPGAPTAAA